MRFSNTEKIIYQYLISKDITQKSASEIAQQLFVSRASIYRVCYKMGYKSFSQFKYLYNQKHHELKQVEVQPVFDFVDESEIVEILEDIINAEQIYVWGAYATNIASSYFVRQLVNLGFKAILISDSFEFESRSKSITKNDIFICLSNSGVYDDTDLKNLRHLPCELICITKEGSALAQVADKAILFDFPIDKNGKAFDRENLFHLVVIAEKILVNVRENISNK